MKPVVLAIATMDTKGDELALVAERLRAQNVSVLTVDVGTGQPPTEQPDVSREQVLESLGNDSSRDLESKDRGIAVTAMGEALTAYLSEQQRDGRLAGVIGIGGSGGTALITAAMRAMPIGMPKVMLSTVASGNTLPYVDSCDITMMYSVVDIAGINVVSERMLSNAAHAMAGMVNHALDAPQARECLAATMFGVTTPCVTSVRKQLEEREFDCLVFHATGTGGRAMENLVRSGMIRGVIDVTTTEVADEVVGGILSAGPERLDALIESRVPLVLSVGAVDMVNFGARESVPAHFADRTLHVHNAQVTLMRTTPEENRQIAGWIADKLNRSTSPLVMLIPEGGVSMLDAPGQPFHDPDASAALFDELETRIETSDQRQVIRLPYHINDPEFANSLVSQLDRLMQSEHPE